jgi:hypothetical protein
MTCDHCLETVTALVYEPKYKLELCSKCLGKLGLKDWREATDEQLR